MKLQKVVFLLVISFLFSFLFAKATYAATGDCSVFAQNASLFDAAVNQQRFAQDMVTSIGTGPISSILIGVPFEDGCEASGVASAGQNVYALEKLKKNLPGSGLGIAINLTSNTFKNAKDVISTKYYAQNLIHKGILGKSAYAATDNWLLSTGVILNTWESLRNVTYVLFVLIFVVLGFMVMFRKRIDPQTIVTLQNSLPNVMISLILITFSYPLAAIIFNTCGALISWVTHLSVFDTIYKTPAPELNAQIAINMLGQVMQAGPLLSTPGAVGGAVLVVLFTVFFWILLCIAFIVSIFSMLFTLIKTLGKLVFLTIISPFIFLMGALPGNQKTMLNWFKNILSITLQVPAMWFVFSLGLALAMGSLVDSSGFLPFMGLLIGPLISIFVLFSVGKVPKAIDNALGVEPLMFGDDGKGKRGKK